MDLIDVNLKGSTLLEDIRDALLEFQELLESGGTTTGEVNTGRNVGTSGVGVYLGKSGVYLEFKRIRSIDDLILIESNVEDSTIDVSLIESNIDHDELTNSGTNAHSAIDTHIANTIIHSSLNDLITSPDNLWSSQKIQDAIDDGIGDMGSTIENLESSILALSGSIDTKEDAFEKNTAFNLDFGTVSGSVCEGNDSRIGAHLLQFELGGTLELSCIGHYSVHRSQELTVGYLDVLGKPSGSNLIVDIRKNTAAAAGSILSTPLQITPDQSIQNDHYSSSVTVNESLNENDFLYFFVSQVGSSVAGNDLTLQVVLKDA